MTLAEWLLEKYSNNNAWMTEAITQVKTVPVREVLNEIGREELLRQAKQLQEEGFLLVDWSNLGSDIKKMRFPIDRLDALFQREERENPREKNRTQQEYIQTLLSDTRENWLRIYYEELLEQLRKGNKAINAYDNEFLFCLKKISEIKGHMWERIFSEQVFHDSKKFERCYRGKAVNVLRKELGNIGKELAEYEVLAEFGIMNYAQSLCWKGRLVYEIDGTYRVDTGNQRYGTVINAQTLVNAKPVLMPGIKKIMTIENQANYEDRVYEEDTLYLYVHGFLSPKERKFLSYLCEIAPESVEYLHWGDMDLGGMRIYQFLKEKLFSKLQPYRMDVNSYIEAIEAGKGISFDEKKRKLYETFDAKELEPLKQCILKYGKDIEQEGISYDNER